MGNSKIKPHIRKIHGYWTVFYGDKIGINIDMMTAYKIWLQNKGI